MFESFAKWFSIFYHPSAWTHFLPDGDCLGFEKKCGAKWGWNPDRHKPHPGEQPGLSQLSSWRYFIEKFDKKSVLRIFPDTSYLIFWHNSIIWWKCNFFYQVPCGCPQTLPSSSVTVAWTGCHFLLGLQREKHGVQFSSIRRYPD